MKDNKFFPALATLIGTIMGAGFLGIPYVISKSGFIIGLVYLIIVASLLMFVKLYLGEVALRTKGNHQLTGYAEKYLGKKGKIIMFLAMIFGLYPALLAYMIGEGRSLSYLAFGNFNYAFILSLAFWLILSFLAYIGLTALKKYEKISMVLVLLLVIAISVLFFKNIQIENLTYIGTEPFLPFGVIMFSFLAFSAMPEVERILKGQEKFMKRVIIFGTIIPFVVYLIFTIIMIGSFGKNINEIATLTLPRFFSLLGITTMFTAFFASTIAVRDMFRFDFGLGRLKGWLIACIIPLTLFFLVSFFNLVQFTELLSLAGIVSGGLTGILVLLMIKKAKKLGNRRPEYSIRINNWIIALISIIFIIAVALEIFLN